MAFIDSGYNTSTVYSFCENFASGVHPCMGESSNSYAKKTFALRDIAGYAVKRVDLQTWQLKSELYGYLARGIPENGEDYAYGYCHFPSEYGEKYFRQLTAEERVTEKTKSGQVRYIWHLPKGRRNEVEDCRVYALGALYLIASMVEEAIGADGGISWNLFWEYVRGELATA